jgi:hypothetical protein
MITSRPRYGPVRASRTLIGSLATQIMEVTMADEVGSNHNDLSALVRELLELQHEADEKLRTDPHAAVKDAVLRVADSIMRLSSYVAGGSPSHVTPGAALVSLAQAFEDRDQGKRNPLLQPTEGHGGNNLLQEVMFARVKPALAVELLFKAGRKKKEAQEEVAQLLGPDHRIFTGHHGERWRIVKRWRADIDSGDYPAAAEAFDCWLDAALTTIRANSGEPSADDFVKAARAALKELDRYV